MASARPGSKDPSMSFTSTVFDDAGEWWKRGMLVPHEPLRWEFIYMSQALSADHFNGEKWKAKKFFQFWKYFYEAVHEHHGVEEQLYFPHLAKKKALPDKMTNDHRTLMKMMDDVNAMESAFVNDENPAAADQLRVSFNELQKSMCDHFAEEERTIAPLVRDNFTEQEDREFIESVLVPHIIQTYGMGATSRSFGRIEHAMKKWGGDEFAAQWLEQNLPPPLRVLMDLTWRSTYNDDMLGLLRAMELKEEPVDDSVLGQAGAAATAAGEAVAPLASAAAESIAPLASAAGEAASAAGEAVAPAAAAASEAASAGAAAVSDAVSAAGEAVGPAVAGLMGSLSSLVLGGAEATQ